VRSMINEVQVLIWVLSFVFMGWEIVIQRRPARALYFQCTACTTDIDHEAMASEPKSDNSATADLRVVIRLYDLLYASILPISCMSDNSIPSAFLTSLPSLYTIAVGYLVAPIAFCRHCEYEYQCCLRLPDSPWRWASC